MKNKLLLTTALAGSLLVSASAFAETKITGSMDASWSGNSENKGTGTTPIQSGDGIGMETQINIANSGDLNVGGLKYQAGFSLEADGTVDAFEGAYIRVISGGTSFEVSQDSFQPLDGTVTPKVSIDIESMDPVAANVISYTGQAGADVTENLGVGIAQVLPGIGKIGFFYSPQDQNAGPSSTASITAGTGNDNYINSNTDSGYEYNFRGDLGVKGLTVLLGKSQQDKPVDSEQDQKGYLYSAAYNFGKVAVGVSKLNQDLSVPGSEVATEELAVTYAVTDNMSVGLQYAETEVTTEEGKLDDKEEVTMLSAGYNLGAISMSVNYADVQDAKGVAGTDTEFFNVRVGTKF
jgi:hypothetical protein